MQIKKDIKNSVNWKKYLHDLKQLVEFNVSRCNYTTLDIGPGDTPVAGADTIDYRAWPYGVTYQHDVRKTPWPIDTNRYDLIYSSHCFEHLDRFEIHRALSEVHRIGKAGGICILIMPHFSGPGAWNTLGHVRPFGTSTLDDYIVENAEIPFHKEAIFLRWRPLFKHPFMKTFNRPISWAANLNPHMCEQLWCNFVNGMNDIVYVFTIVK